jgi:hypothetical protein
MRTALLAAALLLGGCVDQDKTTEIVEEIYQCDADNHGYGYYYQQESPSGIRIRNDANQSLVNPYAPEYALQIAVDCLGLESPYYLDLMIVIDDDIDAGGVVFNDYPFLIIVTPAEYHNTAILSAVMSSHIAYIEGIEENSCATPYFLFP